MEGICSLDDYGYIAHPKDCRKYYYCQEGTAKIFSCVGGTLWNQATGDCVWPLDSDCKLNLKLFLVGLLTLLY